MKRVLHTIAFAASLAVTISAAAQADGGGSDPQPIQLADPDAIMRQAEQIGLSPAQRDRIRKLTEDAQGEISSSQRELQSAAAALTAELSRTPVDETRALEAFDRVLELERLMKRRHLKLLIAANNILESEQRQQLAAKPRTDQPPEPASVTEKRLKQKVAQLGGFAEALAASGKSPDHIHEMMQSFTSLMEQGEVKAAEALIDQKLEEFRREQGAVPDPAAIEPESLRQEIEALRVEDVAWRQIEWKTCLLDGIRASREHHKPMVLWVFIDRPVDDKRC